MISKIIIGIIGIILAIVFLALALWQYKKLRYIKRDSNPSMLPIFKNYLDLYLLLISIMFIVGSITILII